MKTEDKKEQGTTTREKILRAAMELFADSGYEGCTVQDIARAVGIKAASLYAHFKGKEEIFDATLEDAVERWKTLVDSAFSKAAGIRGLDEGLTAIISAFLAAMAGSTAYRFWTRVYVFPPALISGKRYSDLIKLDAAFARRLRAACSERAEKLPQGADMGDLASSLTHFMMGIMVNSMGKVPDSKEVRTGVSLLVRGFRATDRKGTRK